MSVGLKPSVLAEVFESQENMRDFIFTVKSKKTGVEKVFKIGKSHYKDHFYLWCYVKIGRHFSKLGFYRSGDIIFKKELNMSDGALAISWIIKNCKNKNFEKIENTMDVCSISRCRICNKRLTTFRSIINGMGEICLNNKNNGV